MVSTLWEAALNCTQSEFDAKAEGWRQQAEHSEALAIQNAESLAGAERVIERQRAQVEALEQKLIATEVQVGTEQAAKQQAERMFEQYSVEMSAQQAKLEDALRENQSEMQKAL